MADPTLEARIKALEERTIEVADLPLQQLIRKIEQLGLDASTLPPGLVESGGPLAIRFGGATLTWPSGTVMSAGLTVNHTLGKTPIAVVACQSGVGSSQIPAIAAFSLGPSQFSLQGAYTNGTIFGITTVQVGWIAVG